MISTANDHERIVITGIGLTAPNGNTLAEYRDALLNGRSGDGIPFHLYLTKAIDKLQAGNVWVNSLHYGYDELPFGGVKASGVGREHGPEALDYYLEPKGVVIAGLA